MNPGPQHARADSASSPGESPRIEEPEPEGEERPRSSRDSRDFTEDDVDSDKILGPIVGW
ncbi:hypothetical protein [Polyangium aurulentum]|uniref:hypothetical protein n=1 Tax=Polyangium aurulentum TaxID=2567896 RepID=UPI0010AE8D8C|nr:hypothetical protein [Polyangium aurulentum]UQA58188.1 hypothetical protein E8A73_044215 [Polyangium aurulentum]